MGPRCSCLSCPMAVRAGARRACCCGCAVAKPCAGCRFADHIFRYAALRLHGVTVEGPVRFEAGRNPDFAEARLEVRDACSGAVTAAFLTPPACTHRWEARLCCTLRWRMGLGTFKPCCASSRCRRRMSPPLALPPVPHSPTHTLSVGRARTTLWRSWRVLGVYCCCRGGRVRLRGTTDAAWWAAAA